MGWANHSATDAGLHRLATGPLLNWAGGLASGALAWLAVIPLQTLERFPSFCPFRRFLGIECYGCGMTRAVCAWLHGQPEAALHYNRGVMVMAPALMLLSLVSIVRLAIALIRRSRFRSGEATTVV